MTTTRDDWRTREVEDLLAAILRLETVPEAEAFFRDLCTLGELHDMAQRWAVVRMLDEGLHYGEISRRTGASTATITRIAQWLRHGEGGYRAMLERMKDGAIEVPAGTERPTGAEIETPAGAEAGIPTGAEIETPAGAEAAR